MANRKLRRSVSMTPGTYEELQALAQRRGTSMAQVVTALVSEAARRQGLHVDPDEAVRRARLRAADLARDSRRRAEYLARSRDPELRRMASREAEETERLRAEAFG